MHYRLFWQTERQREPPAAATTCAISADEIAHHHVPLALDAIGAISADEIAHHQVPLAHGAIGAISADD
jgi:hypothetical protein